MTNKIYTIGYSGAKPEQIKQLLDDKGAVLFDIRFSPRSRVPMWSKSNLAAAVGEDRYLHVSHLGNANYKNGGPIEFVNFNAGLLAVRKSDRPVVLMCGCKDPAHCHRTVAADKFREMGYEVEEVDVSKVQVNNGTTDEKPNGGPPLYTQLRF